MHGFRKTPLLILCLVAILEFAPDAAPTESSAPVPYELENDSGYSWGCFGPCDCPVVTIPMSGRFSLTQSSDNGLFRTYKVSNVDWRLDRSFRTVHLTGEGTYRIGGEVAVLHELVLDLSIDSQPPQRFESGLVSGGNEFPHIGIEVALNGFACWDTVLSVRAAPVVPTAVGSEPITAVIRSVEPNPFRETARVDISLARPARIDVVVFDVRGRIVRTLARNLPLEAGPHVLMWNGDRDAGEPVASGTYFVRLDAATRSTLHRVVKLR